MSRPIDVVCRATEQRIENYHQSFDHPAQDGYAFHAFLSGVDIVKYESVHAIGLDAESAGRALIVEAAYLKQAVERKRGMDLACVVWRERPLLGYSSFKDLLLGELFIIQKTEEDANLIRQLQNMGTGKGIWKAYCRLSWIPEGVIPMPLKLDAD